MVRWMSKYQRLLLLGILAMVMAIGYGGMCENAGESTDRGLNKGAEWLKKKTAPDGR